MKRIITSLQSQIIVTHQEATVMLWLSLLLVVGTIGSSIWPESATHMHIAPGQLIKVLDSMQQSTTISAPDSIEQTIPAPTKQQPPSSRVDINRASAAQLESIPGVGPAIAKRIIESRSRRRFTSSEDLLDVKGIGKKKLDRMRPYIITP